VHRFIKPFDEVDADTQASDMPFAEAIGAGRASREAPGLMTSGRL
jgi:hypothetical protein